MATLLENNQVSISGSIISEFVYDHEVYDEKFYSSFVEVKRLSENLDILPITVSENLISIDDSYLCKHVRISGQLRSFNKVDKSGNRHLQLSVFAREFEVLDSEEYTTCYSNNYISLNGYVCKQPRYRETPMGRNITDIILAVNRPYGKSDYLPCIVWGRKAIWAAGKLEVGDHIKLYGRFQSRVYNKKISDDLLEPRTAYEVSVASIEYAD